MRQSSSATLTRPSWSRTANKKLQAHAPRRLLEPLQLHFAALGHHAILELGILPARHTIGAPLLVDRALSLYAALRLGGHGHAVCRLRSLLDQPLALSGA
jgi:hypothetical protein